MTNALKYLGLILILSVIGFLIRDYFLDFSLSQIANKNSQITSRTMSGQFYSHILFALSIGIIPLLYLIIKKMTKLNFMNQGLVSCGIIFVCGILLWQFRIFQLNNRLQKLSEFNIGNGIQTELNFDNLNFGRYLFIGFLIGTILSILIFKNKNKTLTE
ncbi:hypothetical protein [Cellulophaga lytica]|uniref:Uncharacterized protein n=1 Tax=Cellulophaga lytica (strain ATCC 23178 / DSM 7489 / JCM 8516 / NBRC 14961 / NCIMB 1423 / VKM B-1433 / Cy l20) TaxID=867900 RepID=F0RIG3_CELLC|nr:hypothetical protein [Cellulophaga lytica]ADY29292.1 hypothetical protein Celly_1467 [Cellulophaga lytica DSM 7489]WQG76533.1 hypothetical protein SR888_12650 [Cellulophaga lytica]